MSRGLFIGRFEPLHMGHLSAIKSALKKVDSLVIMIGSAQDELTYQNCFTLNERKAMITDSCKQAKIDMKKISIVWAEDTYNNVTWREGVHKAAGEFSVVFSGNPLVRRLFSEDGYTVIDCEKDSPHHMHGTEIRDKIVNDDASWKKDVPEAVVDIVDKKTVIMRIKKLAKEEAEHPKPKKEIGLAHKSPQNIKRDH